MPEMALKTRLSEFSRAKLVEVIREEWFTELLEVLRNAGSFAVIPYAPANPPRPVTEMEHQALNSAYRNGALTIVERIPALALPREESIEKPVEPWGGLKDLPPDPKSLKYVPPQPK